MVSLVFSCCFSIFLISTFWNIKFALELWGFLSFFNNHSAIPLCLAKDSDLYASLCYEGRETPEFHMLVLETLLDFRKTSSEIKEIRDAVALVIFRTPFFFFWTLRVVWLALTHSTGIHYWRWLFFSVRRLDANHITAVPEDSFEGLTQLRHLWLDDNSLTEVPVHPLSNLPTLQALTLALNKISSIPDFAFTNLSSLVVL